MKRTLVASGTKLLSHGHDDRLTEEGAHGNAVNDRRLPAPKGKRRGGLGMRPRAVSQRRIAAFLAGVLLPVLEAAGSWIWWEGEKPSSSNIPASTWLSPSSQTERAACSGSNILTAVSIKTSGPYWAKYYVNVAQAGTYRLYARKIWEYGAFKWQFDGGAWQYASYQLQLMDSADYKQYFPLNWVYLGDVALTAGQHLFQVSLNAADWPNDPHYASGADFGGFDAFLLDTDPFVPRGKLQPGQKYGLAEPGKWNFEPAPDDFDSSALLDLRSLNEPVAGQSGYVRRAADGSGKFVLGDGTPERFWGANVGAKTFDSASMTLQAKFLAKRGVNLVRFGGNLCASSPTNINAVDPLFVDSAQRAVAAFKQEGVYTEFDFFYVLGFTVRAGWGVPGYTNDVTAPTAVLMFDDTLKAAYKQWVTQMFTATNPYTGIPLAQDPAVAVIELQNEDGFFFWSFDPSTFPDVQRQNLEAKFGAYLIGKYGSIAAAQAGWGGVSLPTDAPASGRMGLASAWYMTLDATYDWFLAYTPRMADQMAFLAQLQRGFYQEMGSFFRNTLGCHSLIESCNWITADSRFLEDVERYTYTANDVIDEHPYFNPVHVNPTSPGTGSYAVSVGDYYQSLAVVSNPRQLPSGYKQVAGYANIASESTWVNPNRFKAEGPLLVAAYNSMADVDGWIWYATGTLGYDDSVNKFPLALPSLMGQFPGAALLYRRGDVQTVLAAREARNLNRAYQKQLPLISQFDPNLSPPDNPVFDPATGTGRLDPLAMLVGRVECDFLTQDASNYVATNLLSQMNTTNQVAESLPLAGAAHGQLKLDGGRGLFQVNSPCSQGVSGFLNQAASIDLADVTIASSNQFGTLLVISLDGLPLAQSQKILIQAMTEDNPYGWQEQDAVFTNNSVVYSGKKILSLGQPPMNVVNIAGTVTLKGQGQGRAFGVKVLDENGYVRGDGSSQVIGSDLKVTLPTNSLYTVLLAPPAITNQPQSQAVLSGSNVVFSVGATGPKPLSYQWRFNNVPVTGATNSALTLTNVPPAEGGSYSVVITNWAGSVASAVALLTVNLPAAISAQPRSQTVTAGNIATFSVTVYGTSPLNCQWQFNGADLTDSVRISGSQSNTLVITDVLMGDAGGYAVVVTNAYGSATSTTAVLTVQPATPAVTWANPAAITYGTALSPTQLSATASVPGTFAYSPPAGTVLNAGTTRLSVLFTPSDTTDYTTASASVSLPVVKAPLAVTAGNATRVYGTSNPSFTGTIAGLVNGDSITATYSCSAISSSPVGTYPIVPSLVDPNNSETNYTVGLVNGTLTVGQATATMTWTNPAPIIYGTALTSNQLNATASVPGSFAYSPTNGTMLNVGTNALFVIFTPTDTVDYSSATNMVSVVVSPALLTVTAADAGRPYGQANPVFTGTIAGLVSGDDIAATYTCSATTSSPAGTYPIVASLVDPSNRETNYMVSLVNGTLTVGQAAPTMTWTNPAPIIYGAALTSNQLNATASVPGSLAYTPTNGAVLNAGTNTLFVVFTPTDTVDYSSATDMVSLVVSAASLTVTAANTNRAYGQANPVFTGTIAGLVNGDDITATYTCSATTSSPAGTYPIVASLVDPSNRETNYMVSLVNGTLTVGQAAPTMTWTNPAPIIYGTALTSNQLNATANVPGSFAYNPTNGTVLNVGTNALSAIFTPTDTVDYSTATDMVSLVVSPASLTVTAANTNRAYGQANPVFTGTIAGLVSGDDITATYSCSATTSSPAGTYPIVPSLVDPSNREINYMVSLVNGTLTVTTPLVIQSVIQSANSLTFTWSTTPTQMYQIQYTTNLTQSAWANLGNPIAATNSTTTASDVMSNSQAFYRVVLLR